MARILLRYGLLALAIPYSEDSRLFLIADCVRHHHMDRQDKERLQRLAYKMTSVEVSGLAGLYVYFLLLATAWMEDGGYAGWLVPSEFMDVNYGAALKRYLTDRVTLIRAHRFDPDDVQFGDALVRRSFSCSERPRRREATRSSSRSAVP